MIRFPWTFNYKPEKEFHFISLPFARCCCCCHYFLRRHPLRPVKLRQPDSISPCPRCARPCTLTIHRIERKIRVLSVEKPPQCENSQWAYWEKNIGFLCWKTWIFSSMQKVSMTPDLNLEPTRLCVSFCELSLYVPSVRSPAEQTIPKFFGIGNFSTLRNRGERKPSYLI